MGKKTLMFYQEIQFLVQKLPHVHCMFSGATPPIPTTTTPPRKFLYVYIFSN